MKKDKKYLLVPGKIPSADDNNHHHISPVKLAKLYGVALKDCLVHDARLHCEPSGNLIILAPRFDGNYNLPKE